MKITLLCSDPDHPVNSYLEKWILTQSAVHEIRLVRKRSELTEGDFLFLISCAEIIAACDREKYKVALVLHASDLPNGRGWSPHVWELIEGAELITLTLLEAEDKVDKGKIWKKTKIPIPKHFLWHEINHLLFTAEVDFIDFAVKNYRRITPVIQNDSIETSYFPRRTQRDSRLDVYKSIAEQFDLIRVCDPDRFPAFFVYLGHRYVLRLEKDNG